jgi:hypothetical protein
MKKQILTLAIALATVGITLTSCKKDKKDSTPTLYQRVGGTAMVSDPKNSGMQIEQGRLTLRSVVDSSILVVAADPDMAEYFPVLFAELGAGNTSGLTALSKNFTDFMCTATGATNSAYAYTGKSMSAAHNPASNSRIAVKINSADFDKFVGDIGIGLGKNGVTDAQLINDLVALLNTTKSDIVQQ